ncbi:hypothetical protein D3C72_376910 [compost metagenome]
MIEKHPQQSIFGAAEGYQRVVFVQQVTGGRVQAPAAETEQAAGFGDQQVGRQHPGAAQHGVDPRQQFAGGEGFGQVVVGAHFQAENAVGFVVACGEHQDRRGFVLARAQFAAQHQAVIAGQHDVEHDQVDLVGFQKIAHVPAVGDHGGAQAVLFQVVAHQFANFAIVIDDQDVIDVVHGSILLLFAFCTF